MRPLPTDIPLALALCGLQLPGDDDRSTPDKLRGWLLFARTLGVSAIHLNGATPELRARELDRSARRELAALLRRHDLALAGLDLLIPPAHFVDSTHLDRAVNAVGESIGLVADLRTLLKETPGAQATREHQPVVCLTLPRELSPSVRGELVAHASKAGVRLADLSHHRDSATQPAAASAAPARTDGEPLGQALDPAAILLAGDDPAAMVARHATTLFNTRLTDVSSDGRCPLGRGRLNITELQIALSAWRYRGFATLDLRGVADQERTAPQTLTSWNRGS